MPSFGTCFADDKFVELGRMSFLADLTHLRKGEKLSANIPVFLEVIHLQLVSPGGRIASSVVQQL